MPLTAIERVLAIIYSTLKLVGRSARRASNGGHIGGHRRTSSGSHERTNEGQSCNHVIMMGQARCGEDLASMHTRTSGAYSHIC